MLRKEYAAQLQAPQVEICNISVGVQSDFLVCFGFSMWRVTNNFIYQTIFFRQHLKDEESQNF